MMRKRNLVHILAGLDVALLLVALVIFGYIFASIQDTRGTKHEPETSPVPQAASPLLQESTEPSPTRMPTPSLSPTPEQLTVYETEAFRVSYNTQQLTLSDRSGEAGKTAVTLTFGNLDVPRIDIQVLEALPQDLSQGDLQLLAQAAANAYFADTAVEITVNDLVMEGKSYIAELTAAATDVSPSLKFYIRLISGTSHGIMAVYLTPESTAQEEVETMQEVLQSIQLETA